MEFGCVISDYSSAVSESAARLCFVSTLRRGRKEITLGIYFSTVYIYILVGYYTWRRFFFVWRFHDLLQSASWLVLRGGMLAFHVSASVFY